MVLHPRMPLLSAGSLRSVIAEEQRRACPPCVGLGNSTALGQAQRIEQRTRISIQKTEHLFTGVISGHHPTNI